MATLVKIYNNNAIACASVMYIIEGIITEWKYEYPTLPVALPVHRYIYIFMYVCAITCATSDVAKSLIYSLSLCLFS